MTTNQPDRAIIDGEVSDAALHIPMLKDEGANRFADEVAIRLGMEDGMTRAEAERMYGIPFKIEDILNR